MSKSISEEESKLLTIAKPVGVIYAKYYLKELKVNPVKKFFIILFSKHFKNKYVKFIINIVIL